MASRITTRSGARSYPGQSGFAPSFGWESGRALAGPAGRWEKRPVQVGKLVLPRWMKKADSPEEQKMFHERQVSDGWSGFSLLVWIASL
jgi:hypothetical protein